MREVEEADAFEELDDALERMRVAAAASVEESIRVIMAIREERKR